MEKLVLLELQTFSYAAGYCIDDIKKHEFNMKKMTETANVLVNEYGYTLEELAEICTPYFENHVMFSSTKSDTHVNDFQTYLLLKTRHSYL